MTDPTPVTVPSLHRLAGNSGWLLAERLLRVVVGLAVGVWVARHLGPESFGLLSYALSVVALMGALVTLGLDVIVVRELAREPGCSGALLGTALVLRLIAGVAGAVVIGGVAWWLAADGPLAALLILIALTLVLQPAQVVDSAFQAGVQGRRTVIAQGLALVAGSLLKIALILGDAPLLAFAVASVIEAVVLAIALCWQLRRWAVGPRTGWCFRWAVATRLLRLSWPLAISGLLATLLLRLDQVLLLNLVDAGAVGFYAVAARLFELACQVPAVIITTVTPLVMAAGRGDDAIFAQRLVRCYRLLTWLGLLCAMAMWLLGPPLVQILFGEAYASAAPVVAVLALALPAFFLRPASGLWFLAHDLQGLSLLRGLTSALLHLLLMLWWVPELGPLGAAWALVVSAWWGSSLFPLLFRATRPCMRYQLLALLPPVRKQG